MKSTKICSRCGNDLPHSAFAPAARYKDGLRSWCKSCANAYKRERRQGAPAPRRKVPLRTAVCEWCGKTFEITESGNANKFCSKTCSNKRTGKLLYKPDKPQTSCALCGAIFQQRRGTRSSVYCSRKCADDAKRGALPPELTTQVALTCDVCNCTYWRPRAQAQKMTGTRHRFCSEACRDFRFLRWCEWCGDPMFLKFHLRDKQRFCKNACRLAWLEDYMTGEDGPFWVDGGSADNNRGRGWARARRAVWKRDHARCQDCGSVEGQGGVLDVHHIIPFRLFGVDRSDEANDLSNLVLLCRFCHRRREFSSRKQPCLPLIVPS